MMNPSSLPALALVVATTIPNPQLAAQQKTKPLPDAEIVGLESVTKESFSDLVREKCDGKY